MNYLDTLLVVGIFVFVGSLGVNAYLEHKGWW